MDAQERLKFCAEVEVISYFRPNVSNHLYACTSSTRAFVFLDLLMRILALYGRTSAICPAGVPSHVLYFSTFLFRRHNRGELYLKTQVFTSNKLCLSRLVFF
jgi:hypothetical protein